MITLFCGRPGRSSTISSAIWWGDKTVRASIWNAQTTNRRHMPWVTNMNLMDEKRTPEDTRISTVLQKKTSIKEHSSKSTEQNSQRWSPGLDGKSLSMWKIVKILQDFESARHCCSLRDNHLKNHIHLITHTVQYYSTALCMNTLKMYLKHSSGSGMRR